VLVVNGKLSTICLTFGSSNKSGSLVLGCGLIAVVRCIQYKMNKYIIIFLVSFLSSLYPQVTNEIKSGAEPYGYSILETPYNNPSFHIYGKLLNLLSDDSCYTFKIKTLFIDGEKANEILKIKTVKTNNILTKNNKYAFKFTFRDQIADIWDEVLISDNFSDYKNQYQELHENDLALVHDLNTELSVGCTKKLSVVLLNKQNDSIPFKIKKIKLLNQDAFQPYGISEKFPPYEERINNSEIKGSVVNFDSSNNILVPYEVKIIKIQVYIPEGSVLSKEYIICDNYKDKINCRKVKTKFDKLMLLADMEFIDEMGNIHTYPKEGVLIDYIQIK
jgi:hypothetical protein